MKIFDIFKKKKDPNILPFKEWTDLPDPHTSTSGQDELDFRKKYSIKKGIEFQVEEKHTIISSIHDGNIIEFEFEPNRNFSVYLNEFNKYQVVIVRDDLVDNEYVTFKELKDSIEKNDYERILKGFKYHPSHLETVLELLKYAATHGRINAIKAARNSGLSKYKLSDLMITSAEQGQLEILKYLVADMGIDPTYKDNLAIKIVGDNESNREFLLNDQRVIDRLVKDGHFDLLPDDIKDIFVF